MQGIVFIANTRADAVWAEKLATTLEAAGIRTWRDVSNIVPGVEWERSILEALRASSVVVVVVSTRAMQSDWIRSEIDYARNAGITIVPVMVEGKPYPGLEHLHHLDLRTTDEVPDSFVNAIRSFDRSPRATPSPLAGMLYESLGDGTFSNLLDELTRNIVLLLGNFKGRDKERLMKMHAALDRSGLHPIIFDFVRPSSADFGETIRLLAGLSAFVVADLNVPRSVLMELQLIVPTLAVPVVPLLGKNMEQPALFSDLRKYDWVLEPVRYRDFAALLDTFDETVIVPARRKRHEINARKSNGAS